MFNVILEQAALASSFALGGAILLLLAGTQMLDWDWILLLSIGGLAIALYKTRRRLPSSYSLAQAIDRRLNLHDSLSTALHFSRAPEGKPAQEAIRDAQRAQAERLAGAADVVAAVPFVLPRGIYAAAGLCLTALGLFALRYGMTLSLDLRQPLTRIAFETFFPAKDKLAAKKSKLQQKLDAQLQKLGLSVDPPDSKSTDTGMAPDNALNTVDTPDVNNPDTAADGAKSKADGPASEQQSSSEGDLARNGEQEAGQAGSDQPSDDAAPPGAPQAKANQPPPGEKQAKQGGESNGLMDKMRDAMANLLSKLRMPQQLGDKQQNGSASQSMEAAGRQASNQKGMPSPGKPQADGQPNGEAKGDQGGDKSQNAQGKSGDQNSDRPSAQDAKSGIGRQDGNKDTREAEQLAAMGKISEIIGKRSANITGEVMVEVQSGKQQLRTQYTQHNATHAEGGGEISRDEVPLIYQQFVQQYLEEVRKSPSPKTKPRTD